MKAHPHPHAPPPGGNGKDNGGNGVTVRWVVGLLGSGLVALIGGTLTTTRMNSERIAAVEQRITTVERQLDKMDEKLDHLIERGKPHDR
ncbi:MAG TPA: hypothetical protein VJ739_18455 [Gemmataceae bacterium]|nr:hypothetical protein [Gemmataceae bacterium]